MRKEAITTKTYWLKGMEEEEEGGETEAANGQVHKSCEEGLSSDGNQEESYERAWCNEWLRDEQD